MTTITQAQVNRGSNKETGETYFTIKSDSQPNTWYTQTWNEQATQWECSCPATKPCKHLRAIQEVLRSKRSECLDSRYEPITEVSQKGHLHSARGFSLLK